jgi:hypothetical protein
LRKWIARRIIDRFSARYGYDVGYLHYLLDVSPTAFFRFVAVAKVAGHREAAPKAAVFIAKLVGAMQEDCGPCVQLVADMAREAGIADADIAAALARRPEEMSEDAGLGFAFADAVARRGDAGEAREKVRARWGDKGVVDLTFALQGSRLYPMTKAGLGFGAMCARINVGDRAVEVAKAA